MHLRERIRQPDPGIAGGVGGGSLVPLTKQENGVRVQPSVGDDGADGDCDGGGDCVVMRENWCEKLCENWCENWCEICVRNA